MTEGTALQRAGWGLMLILATGVAAYALVGAFVPSFRSPFVDSLFAEKPARALGHLAAGGIAIVTGAFQFSSRLRTRRPATHRLLGKVYLGTVLLSGASALLLAPVSDGGIPGHYGFGLLAVLWLATSGVAYARARARDYDAHRDWMIRSYALCLAAVTLRIYLPLSQIAGLPFEQAYPSIAWMCWVPNLIVAEWFIIGRRAEGDRPQPA